MNMKSEITPNALRELRAVSQTRLREGEMTALALESVASFLRRRLRGLPADPIDVSPRIDTYPFWLLSKFSNRQDKLREETIRALRYSFSVLLFDHLVTSGKIPLGKRTEAAVRAEMAKMAEMADFIEGWRCGSPPSWLEELSRCAPFSAADQLRLAHLNALEAVSQERMQETMNLSIDVDALSIFNSSFDFESFWFEPSPSTLMRLRRWIHARALKLVFR